jgi:hypothetical protein
MAAVNNNTDFFLSNHIQKPDNRSVGQSLDDLGGFEYTIISNRGIPYKRSLLKIRVVNNYFLF